MTRETTGHPTETRPPGTQLAGEGPATTEENKKVMLRAEKGDEVVINQPLRGVPNLPERLTVIRRVETYHGPEIVTKAELGGETQSYLLTCPGPESQVIVWEAVTGKDNKWRNGWAPIAEVRTELGDVEQYRICKHCGDPIEDQWHARLSVIGRCTDQM